MKHIFLGTLLFLTWSMAHPFYLSVCDMRYNANEKKLEGTLKLFTNDLEDALKRLENKPVDLIHSTNKVQTLKELNKYLKKRLRIHSDAKPLNYQLLGYETEEESTWIYFETATCPPPRSLNLHNSVLYDFLKEQINIINVEIGGVKKSWKLNCPESQVSLDF